MSSNTCPNLALGLVYDFCPITDPIVSDAPIPGAVWVIATTAAGFFGSLAIVTATLKIANIRNRLTLQTLEEGAYLFGMGIPTSLSLASMVLYTTALSKNQTEGILINMANSRLQFAGLIFGSSYGTWVASRFLRGAR